MGKPLMLQEADNDRIEALKRRLHARSKIDVVRSALDLLEREADRTEKAERWRTTAAKVARESGEALRDFRPGSRLDLGPVPDTVRQEVRRALREFLDLG